MFADALSVGKATMASGHDDRPLRPINQLLTNPEGLGDILARAQQLARLEPRIKEALPPTLAPHCALANVRGDTLVLSVRATVFAARIRLLTPQILEAARSLGLSLSQVRIRVGYVPTPPPPPPPRRPLSETARHHLQALADKVDDPELRASIARFLDTPQPEDDPPSS